MRSGRNFFSLKTIIFERSLYKVLQRLIGRNWWTVSRLGTFGIKINFIIVRSWGTRPVMKIVWINIVISLLIVPQECWKNYACSPLGPGAFWGWIHERVVRISSVEGKAIRVFLKKFRLKSIAWNVLVRGGRVLWRFAVWNKFWKWLVTWVCSWVPYNHSLVSSLRVAIYCLARGFLFEVERILCSHLRMLAITCETSFAIRDIPDRESYCIDV